METLKQALEKIENPLRFSSGNAYRNLAIVRDLEVPLRRKIIDIREGVRQRVKNPGDAARLEELIEQMDELFSGFDKASLEEKKRRVSEALIRLETMKSLLAQWSDPGYQRPPRRGKAGLERIPRCGHRETDPAGPVRKRGGSQGGAASCAQGPQDGRGPALFPPP